MTTGEVYEFILVEWRLTPEYIQGHWTDEEFSLMVEKLNARKLRHQREIHHGSANVVPDYAIFGMMGDKVVYKRENN